MSTVVRALQAALAAENAAVYGYGVAGGQLSGAQQVTAQTIWASHETARDTLTAMLTARGATPVAAATTYQLPFPVRDAASAVALAAYMEDRVTTAYLGIVALTEPSLRSFGARGTQVAALRAATWRGGTVAFPGLPTSGTPQPRGTPTGTPRQ